MRGPWIWAAVSLLALSAGRAQGGVLEPSLTDSAGARLLDSYLGAIAAGDSLAASGCWARESLERPGFWQTLHLEIGRMNDASGLREMLAGHTAVVTGTRPEPEGWRLEFEWRPTAGLATDSPDAPSRMHFYVIRQDGRFVFINPVDLLPRAWRTRDEGICVFHYPAELSSADADAGMRFMDARCREVARYLGADSTQKIDVYLRSYPEPVARSEARFAISGGKAKVPAPFMDLLLPASRDQRTLLGEEAPRNGSRCVVPLLSDEDGGSH